MLGQSVDRHWQSNRDGSWFSSHCVEGEGGIDHGVDPPVFLFRLRVTDENQFTSGALRLLLQRTKAQFHGCEIWCYLTSAIEPLLSDLASKGHVKLQVFKPSSDRIARILEIAPDIADA
jgi:hypothetical protein